MEDNGSRIGSSKVVISELNHDLLRVCSAM